MMFKCEGCQADFPREAHYTEDLDTIEQADWRYDPVPAAATNI